MKKSQTLYPLLIASIPVLLIFCIGLLVMVALFRIPESYAYLCAKMVTAVIPLYFLIRYKIILLTTSVTRRGWIILILSLLAALFLGWQLSKSDSMLSFGEWPYLIGALVITPVFQELTFRGWIFGYLKGKGYSDFFIILFSSVLYYLSVGVFSAWIPFISSLLLGYLYVKTRNVYCTIAAHGIISISAYLFFLYL